MWQYTRNLRAMSFMKEKKGLSIDQQQQQQQQQHNTQLIVLL